MKTFRIFLLVLIIIGIIALITQKIWVPKLVNQILLHESKIEKKNDIKIENVTDFYNISATYVNDPFDEDKVIEKFIKQQVDQKKEEWKIGGEVYNENEKLNKQFPDRANIKYEFNISYQKYNSSKFGTVSYVFTVYEYTGGANGNIKVNTFTFNKEGQVVIDNILNFGDNNNDIALTRVLAEKAMTDKEDSFVKDMLYDGLGLSYLKADGITLDKKKCNCDGFFFPSNFQNFIIKDEGLTFIFNKYQITPGAAGTPVISVDWESLKPYFTKEFKNTLSIIK